MRHRAFDVAPLLKGDAELQMRRRQTWRQGNRFAKLFDRLRRLTQLSQQQSKVIARLGVIRAKPDGCLEWRAGAVDITGPPPRRAKMILGVEETRLQLDRASKVGECGIGLAELPANVAETIVRRGKIRPSLQCAFVRLGGAGEIVRVFLRLTEKKESL